MADKKVDLLNSLNPLRDLQKASIARYDEIKKQEKEAKEKALEEERKLHKNNQLNELNRIRDSKIALIDNNSKKIEALVKHLSKDIQLKNDYYSLIREDDKRSFLDRWYDRNKLISENIDELNNKLMISDIRLQKDLDTNKIKYDTEAEKNYVKFIQDLQDIDAKYKNAVMDIDDNYRKEYLDRAYNIFYKNRDGSIDYNSARSIKKSFFDLAEDSIAISYYQHLGAMQKILGFDNAAERTSNRLERVKEQRGNPLPQDLLDTWSWADPSSYLDAVFSVPRILADSSGELLALGVDTAITAVVASPIVSAGKNAGKIVKTFEGISNRLKQAKSKVNPNDFTTINKLNEAQNKINNSIKDILGVSSTILATKAIGSKVGSSLLKNTPILGGIALSGEAKAFDFASERYTENKSPLEITGSDRLAGNIYSSLNALGALSSVKPTTGLSNKLLQAITKKEINNGNKFISYLSKEVLPAMAVEGGTEGLQTIVENLMKIDPNSFDIDNIINGDQKKLSAKQVDDLVKDVLVSAGLGALAGGALKSTAGVVYPRIENFRRNRKKIFNKTKNEELYINKDTISDILNKDGEELLQNISNTIKETGVSKKEASEFTKLLANGMLASQQTIISFIQDKNIEISKLNSLFKKLDRKDGKINLEKLNEDELNLLAELKKDPESFEGLSTALLRNNIVKAISKDYAYMRMAKDRNLLENISTMNMQELEKNFSFIKNDLVEDVDLYDLNIKNNTKENDITIQGQTKKNKESLTKVNNENNSDSKKVDKKSKFSSDVVSGLQKMYNKVLSKESKKISEDNTLISLDPSQKKAKLQSYSLAKLLELKYDPKFKSSDIYDIANEEITRRQEYLKNEKIIKNYDDALSKSLNDNKLIRLDKEILEADKELGQSVRLKLNKNFNPQDTFNNQIKSAIGLEPYSKSTLDDVKKALSNLPLVQYKKISEENLDKYAKELHNILENKTNYVIDKNQSDINSKSDFYIGKYDDFYIDKEILSNALYPIKELFKYDDITNFGTLEKVVNTKYNEENNGIEHKDLLDSMISTVENLLVTKNVENNYEYINEVLNKINEIENQHIEGINAIVSTIDYLKQQDEIANASKISKLINGLNRYHRAIGEIKAYTPSKDETLENYINRVTSRVKDFFSKVKKFFMSRLFGIIKNNELDNNMFNRLKEVNIALDNLYQLSNESFNILNKTNSQINVVSIPQLDLNVNVNQYELYNIQNTWNYISKVFGINKNLVSDVIKKISNSNADKYNYLQGLRSFFGITKGVELKKEDIDNIITNKELFIKISIISYLQNIMQHKGGKVNYYKYKSDIGKEKPDYSVKVIPFYTMVDEVSKNLRTLLDIDNFDDNKRIVLSSLATEFSAQLFSEMSVKDEVPREIGNNNLMYKVETNYRIGIDDNLIKDANFFKGKDTITLDDDTKKINQLKGYEKNVYIAINSSILDNSNNSINQVRSELTSLFNKDTKKDKISFSPYKIKGDNGVINFYNSIPFTVNKYAKETVDTLLDGININEISEKEYNDVISKEYSDKLDKNKIIERNSYIPIITNSKKIYFYVNNIRDYINPEYLTEYAVSDDYIDNVGVFKEEGGINGKLQSYLADLKDLIHIKLGLDGKLGDSNEVPFLKNKFYKINKQTEVSRVYLINGLNGQTNKLIRGFYSSSLYDNLRIKEKALDPNKEEITLLSKEGEDLIEIGKINPIQSIYHLLNNLYEIEADDYTKGKKLTDIDGYKVSKDIYRSLIEGKNLLDQNDQIILRNKANEIINNLKSEESPILSLSNARTILNLLDNKFEGEKDKHRFINFLKDTYIKEDGKTTGFATKLIFTKTMDLKELGPKSGILLNENQDIEGDNYLNFGRLLLPLSQFPNMQNNFFLSSLSSMLDNNPKEFRDRFKKFTQPLMYLSGVVPALYNLFNSIGKDYILSNLFKKDSLFSKYLMKIQDVSQLNDNFKENIKSIINNDVILNNLDDKSKQILIDKINTITDYLYNKKVNIDNLNDIYYSVLNTSFIKDISSIITYSYLPYNDIATNSPNISISKFNELSNLVYKSIKGNRYANSEEINLILQNKYDTKDEVAIKDMLIQPLYVNRQFNNKVIVSYIRTLFFEEINKLGKLKLDKKQKFEELDKLFNKMRLINGDFFNNPVKKENDIDLARYISENLKLDIKQVSFLIENINNKNIIRSGVPLSTNKSISKVAPLFEQTVESQAMYNTVQATKYGFSEQVYDGIIINPMFAEIGADTWNRSFGDIGSFDIFKMYINLFDTIKNTDGKLYDFIFNNYDNLIDLVDSDSSKYEDMIKFVKDDISFLTLDNIYQMFEHFRSIYESKNIYIKNMSSQFTKPYKISLNENEELSKYEQISNNINLLISIYNMINPDDKFGSVPLFLKNVDKLSTPIPMTLNNFKTLYDFFENNDIDSIEDISKFNDLKFEGYKPFIGKVPEISIQLDTNFNDKNKDIKKDILYKTFSNIAYELDVKYNTTDDIDKDILNLIYEIKNKIINNPIKTFTDLFLNEDDVYKESINMLSNLNAPTKYKEKASKITNRMLAYLSNIYKKYDNKREADKVVYNTSDKIIDEVRKDFDEINYIPSEIFLDIIYIFRNDKEFAEEYRKQVINNLATYLYLKDNNTDVDILYDNGQEFDYKTISEAIKEEKVDFSKKFIDINTKSDNEIAKKFSAFNLKLGNKPLEVDYQESKIYKLKDNYNFNDLNVSGIDNIKYDKDKNTIKINFKNNIKPDEAKKIANNFLKSNKSKIEIIGIEHNSKIYNYKNSAVYDYKYYQALKQALKNNIIKQSELDEILKYDNIVDSLASENAIANQGVTLTRLKNDINLLNDDIETINSKIDNDINVQGQNLNNKNTNYNFNKIYDNANEIDVDSIVSQIKSDFSNASKEFRDNLVNTVTNGLNLIKESTRIYKDHMNEIEGGEFLADNNTHRSVIVLNSVTNKATLAHEVFHAITYWAERIPTAEAIKILNEINNIRQLVMKDLIGNTDKQRSIGINSQEEFDYIFNNYSPNNKNNNLNLQEFMAYFSTNEKAYNYLSTIKEPDQKTLSRKLLSLFGKLIKAIIHFDMTYLSSGYQHTKLMNLVNDLSKYNNLNNLPKSKLEAYYKAKEVANKVVSNNIIKLFNIATPNTPEEFRRVEQQVAKNILKYRELALFNPKLLVSAPHRKVIFEFYPDVFKALDLPFTNELTRLAMDFNALISGKFSLKKLKRSVNKLTSLRVSIEGRKESDAQGSLNAFKNIFESNGVELTEELDNSLGYTVMSYNIYDIFRDLNTNKNDYQEVRSEYDINIIKKIITNSNNPEALKDVIFKEMNLSKKNIDMYYYNFIKSNEKDKIINFLDNITNELSQFVAFGGVTNSGYTNIEQVIRDLFNGIDINGNEYKMNLDKKHLKSFVANLKQYIALKSINKVLNEKDNDVYLKDFKNIGDYVNQSENHLNSVLSSVFLLGKMHSTLIYNSNDKTLKDTYIQGYMPNIYNDKADVRIVSTEQEAKELLNLGFEQVILGNNGITTSNKLKPNIVYKDAFSKNNHFIMRRISSVPLKSMYMSAGRYSGFHAKGLTIDELDYIEGKDRNKIIQELKIKRNKHINELFNSKLSDNKVLIEKKEMRIIGNSNEARLHLPKKIRQSLYELDTKGSSFAYELSKDYTHRRVSKTLNNSFYDLLIESSKNYQGLLKNNKNVNDYIPILKLNTNENINKDFSHLLNKDDRNEIRKRMRENNIDTIYVNKYLVEEMFGEQDKNLFDYIPNKYPLLKKSIAYLQKGLSSVIGEYKATTIIRTPEVVTINAISNTSTLYLQGMRHNEILSYQQEGISELNNFLENSKKASEINTKIKYLLGKGSQRTNKENEELKKLQLEYNMLDNLMKQSKTLPLLNEGLFSNIVEDFDADKDDFDYRFIDKVVDKLGDTKNKSNMLNTILNESLFTSKSTLYDMSALITRYSDFIARYALYYHSIKKGMSKDEAINKARDIFVDYNSPTYSKILKLANKYGLTAFSRYWTGIQKVIVNSSIEYPINALEMIIAHTLLMPDITTNILGDNILNKNIPLLLANPERIDDILISLSRWNGIIR